MLLGPTVQMRYLYPVMLALPYLALLMCGIGWKTENEKTETEIKQRQNRDKDKTETKTKQRQRQNKDKLGTEIG